MSTKLIDFNKQKSSFIIFSGIYLFFVTLIVAPFLNAYMFSYFEVSTKVFLVIASSIIGLIQLYFFIPQISRALVSQKIRRIIDITLVLSIISILLSPMPLTSIFGMYGSWENNIIIYLVYSILSLSWFVHFQIMKEIKLSSFFFNLLMTLLISTVSIIGIVSYHVLDINNDYISNGIQRLTLNFKNPLLAAYFIGLLFNFQFVKTILYLGKNRGKIIPTIGNLILSAAIFYTLLLTYTRSAWIASGVALIISILLIFVFISRDKNNKIDIRKIIIGILLITFAIVPFIYLQKDQIQNRNTDLISESQINITALSQMLGTEDDNTKALGFYQNLSKYTSADIRLMGWKWGLMTLFGNPKNFLFGVGLDNLYFEMPKYRDPEFNSLPTDSSITPFLVRNMYINFFVERGILLSIALILLGLTACIKIVKKLGFRTELLLPISIILSFMFQGIFYYPSHISSVLFVFVLSYLISEISNSKNIKLRKPNTSESIVISLLLVFFISYLTVFYRSETTLAHIEARRLTPNPPTQIELEEAAKIPMQNHIFIRYLIYQFPRAESSQKYINQYMDSKDQQDLSIISDRLMLIAREDNDIQSLEKSIYVINNLLKLNPSFPVFWDERGLKYLLKQDFDTAEESFRKAIKLKPDYWTAYMHMGELKRQQCSPEEALDWYQKAQVYIPSADIEINEAKSEIVTPRPECKK